jgi:A/G-specific adenine glycosylase
MLQQTQVDRVVPKYKEWLSTFPTFESLAAATPRRATRTWRPLGYNIRPRRLHAIAREVVSRYDGRLPSDEDRLKSFKGLGDYTVGAVRSFAFGIRAPIVDTNISRLLFRVFVAKGDPKDHGTKRHLWALSGALLPRRHAFDFNQALMDFGAMVCVPRTPRCPECPMRPDCRSFVSMERRGQRGATIQRKAKS